MNIIMVKVDQFHLPFASSSLHWRIIAVVILHGTEMG
jgi:hypothetical protein